MLERIGRDPDPAAFGRGVVTAVLLVAAGVCTGVVAAVEWVLWHGLRILWEVLQLLMALWFGVSVPDLFVVPAAPPEFVAVAVETPVAYDERWDEVLPDRPLPPLPGAPAPDPEPAAPTVDEVPPTPSVQLILGSVDDAEVADELESVMLMSLIGALGEGSEMQNVLGASGTASGIIGRLEGGHGTLGGLGLGGGSVGVRDRAPQVLRLTEPRWSADGPGSCALEVEVDARGTGRVSDWTDCDPAIRDRVADAVRRSSFQAGRVDGEPAAAIIDVMYRRPE